MLRHLMLPIHRSSAMCIPLMRLSGRRAKTFTETRHYRAHRGTNTLCVVDRNPVKTRNSERYRKMRIATFTGRNFFTGRLLQDFYIFESLCLLYSVTWPKYSVTSFLKVNISETMGANVTMNVITFIEIDIRHRMEPLRTLYFVSLTKFAR